MVFILQPLTWPVNVQLQMANWKVLSMLLLLSITFTTMCGPCQVSCYFVISQSKHCALRAFKLNCFMTKQYNITDIDRGTVPCAIRVVCLTGQFQIRLAFMKFPYLCCYCVSISKDFNSVTENPSNEGFDSLVKLHIFQIKKSLTHDQKKHHGREHS